VTRCAVEGVVADVVACAVDGVIRGVVGSAVGMVSGLGGAKRLVQPRHKTRRVGVDAVGPMPDDRVWQSAGELREQRRLARARWRHHQRQPGTMPQPIT